MEEKRSGEFVGAFPSYGYIKSKENNHKLIIDKEAAKIVKKIFEWNVNEGIGNIGICHRLNDLGILNPTGHKKLELGQKYNNYGIKNNVYTWTPSTIRNILSNEIYIGNTIQGKRRVKSYKVHKMEQVPKEEWIRVENTHEPIVDKEIFEKAQKIKSVDTRVQSNGKLSLWAGKLKCSDCGLAMHKKKCKNYEYYICSTYRKKSNKLCSKHTIKVEELEKVVLNTIKLHIQHFINIDSLLKQLEEVTYTKRTTENIDIIKRKKEEEKNKLFYLKQGLYEDWKNNYITEEEYLEYKKKYELDIVKIENNIKKIDEQKKKNEQDIEKGSNWIKNFKLHKNIESLDREIIEELVDYIEIYENKQITIHFRFINPKIKNLNMM